MVTRNEAGHPIFYPPDYMDRTLLGFSFYVFPYIVAVSFQSIFKCKKSQLPIVTEELNGSSNYSKPSLIQINLGV
jgi:hypothetical protein